MSLKNVQGMLTNLLRLLMFSLLLIAFLPLVLLGTLGFMIRLKIKNRGISGTAYEPLFNRLMFHHAGTRDDRAAVKLAPHLPAVSPTVYWLMIGTMGLAARLSGYQGSVFSYPGASARRPDGTTPGTAGRLPRRRLGHPRLWCAERPSGAGVRS